MSPLRRRLIEDFQLAGYTKRMVIHKKFILKDSITDKIGQSFCLSNDLFLYIPSCIR